MQFLEKAPLLKIARDKYLDFYLEDDMFEIEGRLISRNGAWVVQDMCAVPHVKRMIGEEIIVSARGKELRAKQEDTGRAFDMEINRIYEKMKDPAVENFHLWREKGLFQFFQKETDTLIWYEEKEGSWNIELNKINMYFGGERKRYPSLQALFAENSRAMTGEWQVLYYVSSVEEA